MDVITYKTGYTIMGYKSHNFMIGSKHLNLYVLSRNLSAMSLLHSIHGIMGGYYIGKTNNDNEAALAR